MRKGQSISINTIIVAAIALVVLVLVVMIFTGNISRWRMSADRCESNGGFCESRDQYDADEVCQPPYQKVRHDLPCIVDGEIDLTQVCCVQT